MTTWENVLSELVGTRLRADQLERHVADAIDLLHGILSIALLSRFVDPAGKQNALTLEWTSKLLIEFN